MKKKSKGERLNWERIGNARKVVVTPEMKVGRKVDLPAPKEGHRYLVP